MYFLAQLRVVFPFVEDIKCQVLYGRRWAVGRVESVYDCCLHLLEHFYIVLLTALL
jgi:hypothetical protein